MILFFAFGEPKGQPRQRTFAYKAGKNPDGTDRIMVRNYNPGQAENWKTCIAAAAKPHLPPDPLLGPIRLDLTFYFSRPKSHYRTGKHEGQLRPDAPKYHTAKPDRDNLEKAVMDAMKMLGFFRDDAQVCAGEPQKLYCDTEHRQPGCLFVLTVLEQPQQQPERNGKTADLELFAQT